MAGDFSPPLILMGKNQKNSRKLRKSKYHRPVIIMGQEVAAEEVEAAPVPGIQFLR